MTDHVTAEKLNLEEVGRYFEGLGYKVQKLEQPWRHVKGEIKFENEKLFLKLASTQGVGDRTINEKCFNENINSVWKKYIKKFKSPKIFDEGFYQGKYWYIGEFVFGKPLASVDQKEVTMTEKDLIRAGEIAGEIMGLTEKALLPKDREHFKEIWQERAVEVAKYWENNVKVKTGSLLRYIEERKGYILIGTSHGDFVPWHVMKTKTNEYYLIDAEAAQMAGPKFYDVAYFYHRVYTKLKRPELAELFLAKFKEISHWTEKDQAAFDPVLAGRIMGGYFDAERDGVTSLDLNLELEKRLLNQ